MRGCVGPYRITQRAARLGYHPIARGGSAAEFKTAIHWERCRGGSARDNFQNLVSPSTKRNRVVHQVGRAIAWYRRAKIGPCPDWIGRPLRTVGVVCFRWPAKLDAILKGQKRLGPCGGC